MPGKRELVKPKKPMLWLIPTVAAAVLVGGYAGLCIASTTGDTINPHTIVGGQDVGGMTRTEAVQALSPTLDRLRTESGVHVTLDHGEEIAYLSYAELGVTFDADALAEEAYESSHSGSALADGWGLLSAALGRHTAVTPRLDGNWSAPASEKLAEVTQLDKEDFSYEVADTTLTLIKQRDGRNVDRPALKARLNDAEADESGSRTVDLPYEAIPGAPGDLQALDNALGGEMANARYDAETNTILPERMALHFDVAQAQKLLDDAAPGERVTVAARAEQPTVTAEELKKVLFRDVLGTYTTNVGGASGRKANVRLTAERVNGTVLNSGEEFNYYALCGPFSKSNGYQSAPGYENGKTVEMDGGGACQCSSTTYAAALHANLEIVARTAHGFASSYIGLGLDATVSGGGPEFIFRNNTPYPIKVEAIYSSSNKLTVSIIGTKTDDTHVKMRSVVLSTTPYEEEIIEKPELQPGERIVDQTPYTGYVVDTYRDIYDGNGNLISSTYEARSKYNKRNRIIFVAPGEADPNAPVDPNAPTDPNTPATQPTDPGTTTPTDPGTTTPTQPVDPGTTPTPEPTPTPTPEPTPEIPGGINPTPIDEQIGNLTPVGPEEGV